MVNLEVSEGLFFHILFSVPTEIRRPSRRGPLYKQRSKVRLVRPDLRRGRPFRAHRRLGALTIGGAGRRLGAVGPRRGAAPADSERQADVCRARVSGGRGFKRPPVV